jgi:hypothetical protein
MHPAQSRARRSGKTIDILKRSSKLLAASCRESSILLVVLVILIAR